MRVFEGFQKGINLGGWLSQCVAYTEEHFDTFIVEDDIKRIAGWGMDHVRLPVDYDVVETEDGEIKEKGMAHIEDCIKWCRKYDMHVILDVHKTKGYMFDEQAVPNPDLFFEDEELQERFYALWRRMMTYFAKDRDIVAYELLNEVVNPAYAEKWNEIATKTMGIIREYAADAYILVGGVCNNSVMTVPLIDVPIDKHTVLNFHCYEPLCFTHQHASWLAGTDYCLEYPEDIAVYEEKTTQINQAGVMDLYKKGIANVGVELFEKVFEPAVKYAEERDVPLYCGEYGVIDQAPVNSALNWITDINLAFGKYGIGRSIWSYKRMDFGILDEHYDSVRDKVLAAITK